LHLQDGHACAAVTLEGKVHSLGERRVARQAAWSAPGIREVRDRLSFV